MESSPPPAFSQILEVSCDFTISESESLSSLWQGERAALEYRVHVKLCRQSRRVVPSVPMECVGKRLLDFLSLQSCCACTTFRAASEVVEPIGKRELIGVLCVPQGLFLLKPSKRRLIEILSLPDVISREADECCGKRLSCSLEIFFHSEVGINQNLHLARYPVTLLSSESL